MPSDQASIYPDAELEARKERIVAAVENADLTKTSCWDDLDELSLGTVVEHIEVLDDEIRIHENAFRGVLNVYVLLDYDDFSRAEGFPGQFRGRFDEAGNAVVEDVTVDTTSFYA